MTDTKAVIIGAGPAGIAAAIQLKRFGIEFAIFEKNQIGGSLWNANLVENYPGFPEGISGAELVELMQKQLENNGIEVIFEEINALEYKYGTFHTYTDKNEITSEFVIIATGTEPVKLGLDSNDRMFYEVIPLLDKKDKSIFIIGGGDAAFDYALNLSKNNKVTIINRSARIKCLPLLFERAKQNPNIIYKENVVIDKIEEENQELRIISTNQEEFKADYLLVAIGRKPDLTFLSDYLKKYIERDLDKMKDNCLFLIGDVKNGILRQTAIGVGDGLKAAMIIRERIEL